MRYFVALGSQEHAVDVVAKPSGGFDVTMNGKTVAADAVPIGDTLSILIDGKVVDLTVEGAPPRVGVVANGHRLYVGVESERARAAQAAKRRGAGGGEDVVVSPMPGRVLDVRVRVGDEVEVGQALVVVEAMKMENDLRASKAGKVQEIFVAAGAAVEAGAKLVRIG